LFTASVERPQNVERVVRPFDALIAAVAVYPLGTDLAGVAGRLEAEQQSRGVVIPFADLLIGATALRIVTQCSWPIHATLDASLI
jgi:predicted nucleic acid-binding protein